MIPPVHSSSSPSTIILESEVTSRRRLQAECNEIKSELLRSGSDTHVVRCIHEWHKALASSQRHPDHTHVIKEFTSSLERLFEDPLHPGNYSTKLFGNDVEPIVQFLIRKMLNTHSVFYSAIMTAAMPAPPTLPSTSLESRMPTFKEHTLRSIRARMIQRSTEQSEWCATIQEKLKGLEKLGQDIDSTKVQITAAMERLIIEAENHRKAVDELANSLHVIGENMSELERQNIELKQCVHNLDEAIKKQKNDWLGAVVLVAVSVAVTWGASSIVSGATFQATQSGVHAGITIIF